MPKVGLLCMLCSHCCIESCPMLAIPSRTGATAALSHAQGRATCMPCCMSCTRLYVRGVLFSASASMASPQTLCLSASTQLTLSSCCLTCSLFLPDLTFAGLAAHTCTSSYHWCPTAAITATTAAAVPAAACTRTGLLRIRCSGTCMR